MVWALIGVGWGVGRAGALGPHGRYVLNRTTFFVASPALVLVGLLQSDPTEVLSTPMAVAATAGLSTGLLMVLVLRLLTKRRGRDLVVGAISSSVVNGANMGFPIAAYVLGDISHAIPVILFQQAIYTPLYLFVLHSITQEKSPGLMGVARSIGANPTIIASAVGLVLSLAGVQLPEVVLEPVRSLADMAIPAMLLAYGLSLYGSKPLAKDDGYRGLIALASGTKLLVMPAIALGVGLLLGDRTSTRLNSSHVAISYAVCVVTPARHPVPTRRSSDRWCSSRCVPWRTWRSRRCCWPMGCRCTAPSPWPRMTAIAV